MVELPASSLSHFAGNMLEMACERAGRLSRVLILSAAAAGLWASNPGGTARSLRRAALRAFRRLNGWAGAACAACWLKCRYDDREAPDAAPVCAPCSGRGAGRKQRTFLSGAHLGARLGVSRSACGRQPRATRTGRRDPRAAAPGIPTGPRLQRPRPAPSASASPLSAKRLRRGDCQWSTGSTNSDLLARPALSPGPIRLTDRGISERRSRQAWPALVCSARRGCLPVMVLEFDVLPPQSSALSLAVGVSVLRALHATASAASR